jgi:hypothetical protein
MKQILLTFMLCLMANFANAQAIDIFEKDHAISRKSRKGYLGAITPNEAKGTFEMVFVLKPTARKIPYEIYTFDKELNLLDTKKDEEELEKMRTRFKWFKFKGDTYETKSVYARTNMKAELVLREKNIKWKWSWLLGGYSRKVSTGAKIKPKDETGANYEYWGGFYDNDAGYVLLPVWIRNTDYTDLKILKVDGDAKIEVAQNITLPANYKLVSSTEVEGELSAGTEVRDWVLLYASDKASKAATTSYTYIRIAANGTLIEQQNINVKNGPWRIVGCFQKNNELYFYGPSIDKDKYSYQVLNNMMPTTTSDDADDDKSGNVGTSSKVLFGKNAETFGKFKAIASGEGLMQTQADIDTRLDDMKYSNFQIAKIANGKLEFVNNPSVSEINKANVKPEGQKSTVDFDGKRFITTTAKVNSGNNLFIGGQDYTLDKMGKNSGSKLYKGLFMMQYDANGNYLRNYGVQLERKKYLGQFSKGLTPDMYPASCMLFESADKKNMYWLIGECKAIDTDTDVDVDYNYLANTKTTTITTSQGGLYTVMYGALNTETGKASEFKVLGDDEKRSFYLFPNLNTVELNRYIIFLSETKKGDKILLSRLDLSK